MIKASELRQGNYVKFEGSIIPVLNITQDTPDAEGVALTPEILEKAGFKKEDDQPLEPVATLYYLDVPLNEGNPNRNIISVTSKHYKGDNETVANLTINGLWASRNVLYVHHLQNLYFYITGKELKIEL